MCVCVCMTHSFREESTPRLQAGDQHAPPKLQHIQELGGVSVLQPTLSPPKLLGVELKEL